MSSRRREGGIETSKMEACTHNRKFVTSRHSHDKSNEVNGGFMQTGAFISLLTGQVPSSVSTPPPSSLFPLPFFFRSLLTAHFCHACRANRRPPSQRPPFLIYRETWEEVEEGGERAIYPPYLAYGVDGAWLLILLEIFL